MGELQPLCQAAEGLVADDDPCCTWQAFVDDLGDGADLGVYVGGDHHVRVDVGDAELG